MALATMTLGAGLAACSDDDGEPGVPAGPTAPRMPTTTVVEFPTGVAPATSVEFRPVVDGTRIDSEGQVTLEALGPVVLDGNAVERATAGGGMNGVPGQWSVQLVLSDGDDGIG
ncbi:MAG TPA: hypothetical protein VIY72_12575, partial [Acidimicrobiales bacterium]